MGRESGIETFARDGIKAAGGRMLKFVSPGFKGVMDDIVIWPGVPAVVHFIEFKAPKKDLNALQNVRALEFTSLGCTVVKLDTYEKVQQYLLRYAIKGLYVTFKVPNLANTKK